LRNIKKISSGQFTSFAINETGSVFVFGFNSFGQLGLNSSTSIYSPMLNPFLININEVSSGITHTLALDENGFVYSFGENKVQLF
jgi:alpha-tubulin suppressor-like RCC1 family protein